MAHTRRHSPLGGASLLRLGAPLARVDIRQMAASKVTRLASWRAQVLYRQIQAHIDAFEDPSVVEIKMESREEAQASRDCLVASSCRTTGACPGWVRGPGGEADSAPRGGTSLLASPAEVEGRGACRVHHGRRGGIRGRRRPRRRGR